MSKPMDTLPQAKLLKIPAREAARMRCFVFPHAGSGAFPYRPLAASLPPFVEVVIAQLPGRETTFGQAAFHSMNDLAASLVRQIEKEPNVPSLFIGHSFGAHVALFVCRLLEKKGAPLPLGLVASSARAPHKPSRQEPMATLPRAAFVDRIRKYGGTPEAVLANEELLDLFLPPLRVDLGILETYKQAPGEPFSFPLFAFGGEKDTTTHTDDLEAWREHTTGTFTMRLFEGGHFYLFEQSKAAFGAAVSEIITVALKGATSA